MRAQASSTNASSVVQPVCPGCPATAPPPRSSEADRWVMCYAQDGGAEVLCPKCGASPEARQRVEDERRRESLSIDTMPSLDTIVFVDGEAKRFGDCTTTDLGSLADQAQRKGEQDWAWAHG